MAGLAAALLTLTAALADGGKGFWIQDDKFHRDGKAVQIISGRSVRTCKKFIYYSGALNMHRRASGTMQRMACSSWTMAQTSVAS